MVDRIPVTTNFNNKPVGYLQLMNDHCLLGPGMCLAVGGIVKKRDKDGVIIDFELTEVSIIPSRNLDRTL